MGSIVVALKRGTMVLPAPVFNAYKTLEPFIIISKNDFEIKNKIIIKHNIY